MSRALSAVVVVTLVTVAAPIHRAGAQQRVGPPARVHVEADAEGLALALVRGTHEASVVVAGYGGYAVSYDVVNLCTAPCELELPTGGHDFLVSRRGARLRAEHTVSVTDGATLRVHWDDRSGLRSFGWALWVFLQLGGAMLAATPFAIVAMQDNTPDFARVLEGDLGAVLAAGVGTYLLGWIAGLGLAGLRDVADVRVVPGGIAF